MTPTTETERHEIEQYAYHLYEQRGCQPGHELEDWLEAEKRLMNPNPAGREEQSRPRPDQQKRKAQRIDDY